MSKTVLIVDDSMVSRMMVKEIVQAHIPDVTIIEASGGHQALEQITPEIDIDIALIDYNMPEMNGLELIFSLKLIVAIPKRALLTANIQDSIRQQAEDAGVTFLNKPITEEVIGEFLNS